VTATLTKIKSNLTQAPITFANCLTNATTSGDGFKSFAMQKYNECVDRVKANVTAQQLATNLTELLRETENSTDCGAFRARVQNLVTNVDQIKLLIADLDAEIPRDIFTTIEADLPYLRNEQISCMFYGNRMDIVVSALMQLEQLDSLTSDVSTPENLRIIQGYKQIVNESLVGVLMSPTLMTKEATDLLLKSTNATIEQLKSFVNASKTNDTIAAINLQLADNFINIGASTRNFSTVVYGTLYPCVFKSNKFQSEDDKKIRISDCLGNNLQSISDAAVNLTQNVNYFTSMSDGLKTMNEEAKVTLLSSLQSNTLPGLPSLPTVNLGGLPSLPSLLPIKLPTLPGLPSLFPPTPAPASIPSPIIFPSN
jgi:hypothetical protein